MSDGLTDGYRSTMAAERRLMLLRSVTTSLRDRENRGKTLDAVNDIMFFQDSLYSRDPSRDREEAATAFLSNLQENSLEAWAQLMAFALRDYGSTLSRKEFQDLKDLSPFKGKTLAIAIYTGSGTHLHAARDFETELEAQLSGKELNSDHLSKLVALDLTVTSAFDVKT
ncbi:MAG: hypothetical protein WC551_03690 [Patescibacteria group bacterium]